MRMPNNKCHSCDCYRCTGKYCAQKVYIFSDLSEQQISEVVDLIERKNFKKGDNIFLEGDVSDRLYIVNSGSIKAFRYTKEGKEQILYIMSSGDSIGELNLLKKSKYKYSAAALEDTNMCIISKDNFDGLLKKYPELTLKILEGIHDRMDNLEDLVQNLSTKDVEARIADLLLHFIKDFGVETKHGIEMDMPLSREEMGNYIGTTRETISRKLASLQEEGVIEMSGSRKIIIKDINELKALL
jgi:CRP/FNR family transcriptional regulator